MNILARGAHPDDIEFGCGGLLTKLSRRNHSIYMALATTGQSGGGAKQRVKEQEEAAALLNAELIWGDFVDTELMCTHKLIKFIEKAMEKSNPDEIYFNFERDLHQDHVQMAKAALSATRAHPCVMMYEDYTSVDFSPDIFVDIKGFLEDKYHLLLRHQTQVAKPCIEQMDIIESTLSMASYRGFQAKVKYAEGFKAVRYLHFSGL